MTSTYGEALAAAIKGLAAEQGLSIHALALAAGIGKSRLSDKINKRPGKIDSDELDAIAAVLGIEPVDIAMRAQAIRSGRSQRTSRRQA